MTYSGPARAAARSPAFSAPSAPAARHVAWSPQLLAAIALVALIGTGCSNAPAETGSGGGERPATEGSPSTEPDSNAPGETGGGGDQNDPAEAAPNPAELQALQKKLPEFAKCMRENGVEDFPDPGADGTIQYYGDPDPAEFKSASERCGGLLPEDRGRNR